MKRNIIRPIIEILSIMVLFYTNLLMGQFLRTSSVINNQSILEKLLNIVTPQNIIIGLIGATIGFIMVEFVNRKYITR